MCFSARRSAIFAHFLFGWTQFLIIQTGINAAVAIAFAKYLGSLVPGCGEENVLVTFPLGSLLPAAVHRAFARGTGTTANQLPAQVVAGVLIVLLTAVNIRGLREGIWVQNVFTVLKVAALLALILAGLRHGIGSPHFIPPSGPLPAENALGLGLMAGLAVALSKALFAYDCWYTVTFVAEEVQDTNRTLPYSLLLGTVIVTAVYVLANLAYLAVLPVDQIAGAKEDRVAVAVGTALFGNLGAMLVIVAVLVSTFGCLNGLILGGARVCYAMARDGLFLRGCAESAPAQGHAGHRAGLSGHRLHRVDVHRVVLRATDVHDVRLGVVHRIDGRGGVSAALQTAGFAASVSVLGLSRHAGAVSRDVRGVSGLRDRRQQVGVGNRRAADSQRHSVLCDLAIKGWEDKRGHES